MINLLPTAYRQSLAYARKNTSLRGWIITLTIVLLGVVIITGFGYWYLNNEIKKQQSTLQTARAELQRQNIDGTRKRLDEISSNTKLILQVLEREVLFSKLLRQLGASLPPNTALSQIQIDELDGGLTLQAKAANIDAATQLQVNLQDPENKIFEKADIENITCDNPEPGSTLPCTVQLRALFAKENPYTYIPSKKTTTESKQP